MKPRPCTASHRNVAPRCVDLRGWRRMAVVSLSGCEPRRRAAPLEPVAETTPPYAFTNVDVVSMTSDRVDPDQNVVVADGRIAAVGPAASVAIPPGARVVDGRGKYLAPGLADMHAHPMTTADLDAYLTTGVTLIRAMWGEPAVLTLREGVASGAIAGPRIFTGGRIVDGEPVIHYGSDIVLNAADATDVVTRHKAAGYDFIKVYSNLSVEAFDAIAEAARANDIPFAGHIPDAVAADHAFRSGMQTAEHLIGIGPATLAEGAEYYTRFDPSFPRYAARIGSGEISLDAVYDETKLAELANLARETGIWTVPTLTTIRGTAMSPDEAAAFAARDAARYVDYTVMSFWQMSAAFRAGWTPDTYRGAGLQLQAGPPPGQGLPRCRRPHPRRHGCAQSMGVRGVRHGRRARTVRPGRAVPLRRPADRDDRGGGVHERARRERHRGARRAGGSGTARRRSAGGHRRLPGHPRGDGGRRLA